MAEPTPAGRPAPSRFDQYAEPLWKRIYWAGRVLLASPRRRRILRAQIEAQPNLASFYGEQLSALSGLRLVRLAWRQLAK